MAVEPLMELLLQVARRPSAQCLHHTARSFATHNTHLQAEPASRTTNDSPPNPPAKRLRTPPAIESLISSSSKIPLHIGLDRNPDALSAISRIPIPRGVRGEKFTPSVLSRPLGLTYAPLSGQNTPLDKRTWSEKKSDFENRELAMERRRVLFRSFLRPYFQEWKRVDHFKGKSFVGNKALFRREKALFFPNMWGQTLAKEGDGLDGGRDLSPMLEGKITVVGIQSGKWAEEQVDTFLSEKGNPELKGVIDGSGGLVQRAAVNVQNDWVRSLLVKLFKNNLRKMVPEEQWERYFMVKLARDVGRGLTEDIRDAMGFLNSQVGYVYLVDQECRIRWAGSGHAWEGEVDSLNNGIRRLVAEAKALPVFKHGVQPSPRKQSAAQTPPARKSQLNDQQQPQPMAATA